MKKSCLILSSLFMLCSCAHHPMGEKIDRHSSSSDSEWSYYASDAGSSKFAPIRQINQSNVKDLKIAWVWKSIDNDIVSNRKMNPSVYQSTPLMIGGRLFVSTSLNQVTALDPNTGVQLWNKPFDPEIYKTSNPTNSGFVHRGVAYWADGDDERIIFATNDGFMFQLDAKTGQKLTSFAENGQLDLTANLGRPVSRDLYGTSSPPLICDDTVIIGSSVGDFFMKDSLPPGDVRGFDVRSGKLKWTFHTIPADGEFGTSSWKFDEQRKKSGNTNAWAPLSSDPKLHAVFLPLSSPTNDLYGGNRLGDGLFGESLVSLDCRTGKRNWHYQILHHGLWDYDLPAPPIVMDITVKNKKIKAIAQVTKQGFVFVLNRENGKPIWPIVERPVPASHVDGEVSSPTQPIPTRPPPFDLQGLEDDNLINFTPQLKAEAQKFLADFNRGPLYTPPALDKRTIALPGGYGGASWAGAAFSPETGRLYVPSVTNPLAIGLDSTLGSDFKYSMSFVTTKHLPTAPNGLPLTKPPYGRVTSIDMNTGTIDWVFPMGKGPKDHPLLKDLPLPPADLGWSRRTHVLVTPDILFAAQAGPFKIVDVTKSNNFPNSYVIKAENDEAYLRAIDPINGKLIAKIALPANATGAPMTYMLDGKQYIVLPYGGAGLEAGLVALSLQ